MSRKTACAIVKTLATRKRCTADELAQVAETSTDNIREWMYAMSKQGMTRLNGHRKRTAQPGRSTRGKTDVGLWEWLL